MTTTTFICNLPEDVQEQIKVIVTESIVDMCLTKEEGDEAFENAMCGRVCDLSELLRYGEVLALLHISGAQVFGEVELMVTYCESSPVVTFYDWLVANDYTEKDWDNDELTDNFLDFCNDWGLNQSDF